MEQGFWGAVIAAIVSPIVLSLLNLRFQRNEHKHAKEMQKYQWEREDKTTKEERRFQAEQRIREMESVNIRQANEFRFQREMQEAAWRETVRQEREREQRNLLMEVQQLTPRFVHVARTIYEARLAAFDESQSGKSSSFDLAHTEAVAASAAEFEDLRSRLPGLIQRIDDPSIAHMAQDIYQIALDMALISPSTWRRSTSFYEGRDPVLLVVPKQSQLQRAISKVLSGKSIEDEPLTDITERLDRLD